MVWQWFGGVYKDARDPKNMFPRFGSEPDHLFNVNPEFQLPDEQKIAFQRERTGAIVTHTLANEMNFHLGDRITHRRRHFPGHAGTQSGRDLRRA